MRDGSPRATPPDVASASPTWTRRRALHHGLSLAGVIVAVWFFGVVGPKVAGMGYDAFAYWDVRFPDLYGRSFGQLVDAGAFRYAPPIGALMTPFHLIPFWQFLFLWTCLQVATLIWLGGTWTLALLAFPGTAVAIYEGNIDLLIAASVVIGLRYPAAWSFGILTKVTPGIGLLWFAARGEWRSVGIAVGTSALAALTIILWPDLWADWFRMLIDNSRLSTGNEVPLSVRLVLAGAMTIWAARTDRPWVVGLAVAVAQPAFGLRSAAVGISAVGIARRYGPSSLGAGDAYSASAHRRLA